MQYFYYFCDTKSQKPDKDCHISPKILQFVALLRSLLFPFRPMV